MAAVAANSPRIFKAKIVAIGMAGQGKSTALNAWAESGLEDDPPLGEEDLFKAGAGAQACTTEILQRKFTMSDKDKGCTFEIELTDTMGFPDPDPRVCRDRYEKVVAECNKEQNLIVWIHKASRNNHSTVEQLKVLLREFNEAMPPIILVMNGCEAYPKIRGRPPANLEERKEAHRRIHKEMGHELADLAGVKVAKVIAGADMEDLYDCVRNELMSCLSMSRQQASKIKSCADIEREMKAVQTAMDMSIYEQDRAKAANAKAEMNCHSFRQHSEHLREAQEQLTKQQEVEAKSLSESRELSDRVWSWVPGVGYFVAKNHRKWAADSRAQAEAAQELADLKGSEAKEMVEMASEMAEMTGQAVEKHTTDAQLAMARHSKLASDFQRMLGAFPPLEDCSSLLPQPSERSSEDDSSVEMLAAFPPLEDGSSLLPQPSERSSEDDSSVEPQ